MADKAVSLNEVKNIATALKSYTDKVGTKVTTVETKVAAIEKNVGTGNLAQRVSTLETKVANIETKLANMATLDLLSAAELENILKSIGL